MAKVADQRVPLARETRVALTTAEAAAHLNRAPQTLRVWALRDDSPIRPLHIRGRLAWPVSELRKILGCDEKGAHGADLSAAAP